jgi:hypothetical protein
MSLTNAHFCTGKVLSQEADYWVLEASREIESKGETRIYTDEVHVFGKRPSFKYAAVGGRLENVRVTIDDEEVTRTYLMPKQITKAKASDHMNAGEIVGNWFRWDVISGKKGKKTFGAQLIKVGTHIVRAVLFENPSYPACSRWNQALMLADAAREGTIVKFAGRLRVYGGRLEQVADKADIVEVGANLFAEASAAWDSEETDEQLEAIKALAKGSSVIGAAPDDSGAIPDPV